MQTDLGQCLLFETCDNYSKYRRDAVQCVTCCFHCCEEFKTGGIKQAKGLAVLSLHLCNRPFCRRYCFTATACNHPANAFYQLWIPFMLTSSHGLRPDRGHALRKDWSIKQLWTETYIYIYIFIWTNYMNSLVSQHGMHIGMQPVFEMAFKSQQPKQT